MEPSDWIAISGVAATVAVTVISLLVSSSAQRRQQDRDDTRLKAQQEREDALRERRREDTPHIEFSVDCQIHGRRGDEYVVEFVLVASNTGSVQQRFTSILLRVRGIAEGRPLAYWPGNEPRLEFPITVLDDTEVKPPTLNYLFVEPGVRQVISYSTKIPAEIEYIAARVKFAYDVFTPHTAERVFCLIDDSGSRAHRDRQTS